MFKTKVTISREKRHRQRERERLAHSWFGKKCLKLTAQTFAFVLKVVTFLRTASVLLREEYSKRCGYVKNPKYSEFMNQNVSFSFDCCCWSVFISTQFIHSIAVTFLWIFSRNFQKRKKKNEPKWPLLWLKLVYCVKLFWFWLSESVYGLRVHGSGWKNSF